MARLNPRGQLFTDLLLEVFRLNGALLEAGDELTRPVGLTSARWQVLGVVEHGPVPVANVARIMGLSRQTVQQTANGLERDGFIEFVDNPHHRRAKLMRMTEKGKKALEYVTEQQAVWANRVGGEHQKEDLEPALEVLKGLRESLEQDQRKH
jgi:DNA-binding MarR family transcriptional regulator